MSGEYCRQDMFDDSEFNELQEQLGKFLVELREHQQAIEHHSNCLQACDAEIKKLKRDIKLMEK